MYGRFIFNMLSVTMVLIEVIIEDPYFKATGVGSTLVILSLWSLMRPFRNIHTNVLFIILNFAIGLCEFEMLMKVSGFKSTYFVDKYFFWMQVIQNGFLWFMMFVYCLFLVLIKS